MRKIAIVGTDTDVGKTIVTLGLSLLLQSLGYRVAVMKPFTSGCNLFDGEFISDDTRLLQRGCPFLTYKEISPIRLEKPLAPMVAATLGNIKIELKDVFCVLERLSQEIDYLLVEGVGGLMVPIKDNYLFSDFVKELGLSTIVVARAGLGTINHSLLTMEALERRNIKVDGLILNRYNAKSPSLAEKTNPKIISEFSHSSLLGIIPEIQNLPTDIEAINLEKILKLFKENINCQKLTVVS